MSDDSLILLADIGATHARFALANAGRLVATRILGTADDPTLEDACRRFLTGAAITAPPRRAAIAVAAPVTGDQIALTNASWSFSVGGLRASLDLERLAVINDLTAIALAVPGLAPQDRDQIGPGEPYPGAPIAVIAPGSGLGVSGVVFGAEGWSALSGEGGHVTLAAGTPREAAVIAAVGQRFAHVSAERLVSGPGLVELYRALAELARIEPSERTPAAVTTAALDGSCPLCVEALELFCGFLASVAGNLALTLGARGGVYLGGGILPRLGPRFARSSFRERFCDKGRLRQYLEAIPTFLITHPLPAFAGLQQLMAGTGTATGIVVER